MPMPRPDVLAAVTLALLSAVALAATPDICDRRIEGVSVAMSYAEAKAEWTARGFKDTTPTQLARGRPNNQTLLQFERGGGANLQNPGGLTLTWSKDGSDQTTVSLSEAEAVRGAPSQRLRERLAEFCPRQTRSPDLDCRFQPPYIEVISPVPGTNLQCRYTAAGNTHGGANMTLESVTRRPAVDTRSENKKAIVEQLQRR
jgi:hypothetical protein